MTFNCVQIKYNDPINWDEFVDITFIGNDANHLTCSSLIYENDINIELNDQINVVNLLKRGFRSSLEKFTLNIELNDIQFQQNFPDQSIQVILDDIIDLVELKKALENLVLYQDNDNDD